MLKVIGFVREHGVDALTEKFGILVKRHPGYPNLVFLKYHQINSPMAEPIVQECRGLILDESADWAAVSFPFRKFFNAGEGHAAEIDWSTARVYEKLDGSLMTLYWYDGAWRVASNGTPDAGGAVCMAGAEPGSDTRTFAELFWQTWEALGYGSLEKTQRHRCYMFELQTDANRVVVPHERPRLVLIGIRDLVTLEEIHPCEFACDWERVRWFDLGSVDACIEAAKALNPLKQEGFVVCDAKFNRLKVKSPQYVALSHMKDSFTERRILEMVRSNESDEFLAYFPEYRPQYNRVRDAFDRVVSDAEGWYEKLKEAPSQKDFALGVQSAGINGAPLYALRAGKVASVREFYAQATLQAVERAVFGE